VNGTFQYSNPLSISWGPGALTELAATIRCIEAKRVLLVSTAPVLDNPDLMALFRQSLPAPPVAVAAIGSHAPVSNVEHALELRRGSRPDLIVSLGGGGPIDAAKAVARGRMEAGRRIGAGGAGNRPDLADQFLPHLAVPTTLSAAELSWRAGFADASGDKVGFADRRMAPTAVFYDPRLAAFTPLALWLSTGVRAVDHAVEGFLAPGCHPFSDVLAVEAIARLDGALRASAAAPGDLDSRARAQVGAWFSYTLPLASMTGLSHQMGKQIGARHGIGHGDTSALLIDHVMRYRARHDPGRHRELGQALDRRLGDGRQVDAADRIEELVVALGLPRHAAAFGVTALDLATAASQIATEQYPASELAEVYREAL
jgi:alcohol dehydrogenase class IV